MILDNWILPSLFTLKVSLPEGGPGSFGTSTNDSVKISRLVKPARVLLDPLGLRNSSNFFIAPGILERSLALRICVVAFQPGPSSCLAAKRIAAVFPTPLGPESSRCGGLVPDAAVSNVSMTLVVSSKSENLVGAFVSSHDVMKTIY